jgi:hypothetical protein
LDHKVISNSRLSNVSSISFTKRFKHYKRRHRKEPAERNISLEEFKIIEEIGAGKYGKVFLAVYVLYYLGISKLDVYTL